MAYPSSNYPPPPQQRSPWFYVGWGCGGCACLCVVVAVVGIFLLGWGVKKVGDSFVAAAEQAERETKADLQVQKHKWVAKKDEHFIVGSLKNVSSNHTYSMAAVSFDLYDKAGKLVNPDTPVTAETQNLKPGASWDFKIPVNDPSATTYKFRDVHGFQDITEDTSLDPATRERMKAQQAEMRDRIQDIIKKAQEENAKPQHP